jgi:hypothetical protein
MSTEELPQSIDLILAGIGQPARRALTAEECTSLEQVTQVTAAELGRLHGVGPKGVWLLGQALAEKGLSFANEDLGCRSERVGHSGHRSDDLDLMAVLDPDPTDRERRQGERGVHRSRAGHRRVHQGQPGWRSSVAE